MVNWQYLLENSAHFEFLSKFVKSMMRREAFYVRIIWKCFWEFSNCKVLLRMSPISRKNAKDIALSPTPTNVLYRSASLRRWTKFQSRSQSPRSSVGGIVGLRENSEENQPSIGCLIISLIHSPLILNSCNFNYSRSKIQTYLLNSTF